MESRSSCHWFNTGKLESLMAKKLTGQVELMNKPLNTWPILWEGFLIISLSCYFNNFPATTENLANTIGFGSPWEFHRPYSCLLLEYFLNQEGRTQTSSSGWWLQTLIWYDPASNHALIFDFWERTYWDLNVWPNRHSHLWSNFGGTLVTTPRTLIDWALCHVTLASHHCQY